MYWLLKIAGAAEWLAGQGVAPEFIAFAMEDRIPRKMQKWLAVQLNKMYKKHLKSMEAIDFIPANVEDFISNHRQETIEIADMYEWKTTHREPLKKRDINQYSFEEALEESNQWQEEMEERRGEGHPEFYQFPRGKHQWGAEDMGDGYYMVDVPLEDLPNEGAIMQHCVGDGGYDDEVRSGKTVIYSLRDAKGWPHATIEVTSRDFVSEEEEEAAREEWEAEYREQWENDPENQILDENGDVIGYEDYYGPEDYDGYEGPWAGNEDWHIEQIQGKQNEAPIDKYRPYLRKWVDNHPDFQIHENDALSITPEHELLERLLADRKDGDLYYKIATLLSEESLKYVMDLVKQNPHEWSDKAIIALIDSIPSALDYSKESIFEIKPFLSEDFNDVIRSKAANSMYIPLSREVRRDSNLREWVLKTIEQEEHAPQVVQEFLKAVTDTAKDPLADNKKGPVIYYLPEDVVPVATMVATRFSDNPSARNLFTFLAGTLTKEVDPDLGAEIVEKAYMMNAHVSTYELRMHLGMLPAKQFWEIWKRLPDNIRGRLDINDFRYPSHGGQYDLLKAHEPILRATHEYNTNLQRYRAQARDIADSRNRGFSYTPENPISYPEWPEYNTEWEANPTEHQLLSRPGIHWGDPNQMYLPGMEPAGRRTAQRRRRKTPDENLVRLYSMHIGSKVHSLRNFITGYYLDIDTYNQTGQPEFLEKAETREQEMRKFLNQRGITAKSNWLIKIC